MATNNYKINLNDAQILALEAAISFYLKHCEINKEYENPNIAHILPLEEVKKILFLIGNTSKKGEPIQVNAEDMTSIVDNLNIINIEKIKDTIYNRQSIRKRICKAYNIDSMSDRNTFFNQLFDGLDQTPKQNPMDIKASNIDVFIAAVKALASNSRNWNVYLRNQHKLKNTLFNFDPHTTYRAVKDGKLSKESIMQLLPGQTSGADAKAIILWSKILSEHENYYNLIVEIGNLFKSSGVTSNEDIMLCIVGFMGNPNNSFIERNKLFFKQKNIFLDSLKFYGMSYSLASEFMRNLGWSGFKPDRHIKRLFNIWFGNKRDLYIEKVNFLCRLIGSNNQELKDYLYYSLLGRAASPTDLSLSQVDNLVWLLGSYIEKLNQETDEYYLI